MVAEAINDSSAPADSPEAKRLQRPLPEKNPAAVALGRLGGLKGGKARAEKLYLLRSVRLLL